MIRLDLLERLIMVNLETLSAAVSEVLAWGNDIKAANDSNVAALSELNSQLSAAREAAAAENAKDDAEIARLMAELAAVDPTNQAAIDAISESLSSAIARWRGAAIPAPASDPAPTPEIPQAVTDAVAAVSDAIPGEIVDAITDAPAT